MLGIILGVASLVAMAALVKGMENGLKAALIEIGGLEKVRIEDQDIPPNQLHLADQAVEYRPPAGVARKDLRNTARDLTLEFLARLPEVREILQTDAEAAFNGDPAALSSRKNPTVRA